MSLITRFKNQEAFAEHIFDVGIVDEFEPCNAYLAQGAILRYPNDQVFSDEEFTNFEIITQKLPI